MKPIYTSIESSKKSDQAAFAAYVGRAVDSIVEGKGMENQITLEIQDPEGLTDPGEIKVPLSSALGTSYLAYASTCTKRRVKMPKYHRCLGYGYVSEDFKGITAASGAE